MNWLWYLMTMLTKITLYFTKLIKTQGWLLIIRNSSTGLLWSSGKDPQYDQKAGDLIFDFDLVLQIGKLSLLSTLLTSACWKPLILRLQFRPGMRDLESDKMEYLYMEMSPLLLQANWLCISFNIPTFLLIYIWMWVTFRLLIIPVFLINII